MARRSAATLIPANFTWQTLHDAAAKCQACDLWERATQTVFGEGAENARVMFVGEQPGNDEDLAGRPFVGPAGRLLDSALEQAGIDRSLAYVTNVVKHFKWEPRGKRRIHAKPNAVEIAACVLGRDFRVTAERGNWIESSLAPYVMATVHPSSILRARDSETRRAETARFIQDLRPVARVLQQKTRKAQ